jgi:hypothetical protein
MAARGIRGFGAWSCGLVRAYAGWRGGSMAVLVPSDEPPGMACAGVAR